ncbi:hypothetical protein [Agarilytica rhodophyticola]|uniref:hypothetical protein n=1 Tax=Agarilytica rhodophyticola TaxID=1737490 RepID=UPI000B347531|nr:hypothetical protein [Agarilytica rhodophyticola]
MKIVIWLGSVLVVSATYFLIFKNDKEQLAGKPVAMGPLVIESKATMAPEISESTSTKLTVVTQVSDSSTDQNLIDNVGVSSSLSASELSSLKQQLTIELDDPSIEYRYGDSGEVLMELDNNENSPSYNKPLKQYEYVDGRLTSVTRFEYFGDKVKKYHLDVAYNDKGELVNYRETQK